MDRGDASVDNSKLFVDHLDDGRETVGSATSVGDNRKGVRSLQEFLVVASQNNVQGARFLDRSRNDDLLDTGINVGLQRGNLEELSGAFHDHFDSRQVEFRRRLALTEFNNRSVNRDVSVDNLDILVPRSVHRIVLDKVRGTFDATKIVDRYNFEGRIIPRVAKDEAANTAVSIQETLGWHACCVRWMREVSREAFRFGCATQNTAEIRNHPVSRGVLSLVHGVVTMNIPTRRPVWCIGLR